jgi:micrococcal nuclease
MAIWKTLLMLHPAKNIKFFAMLFIATQAIIAMAKGINETSNTWQGIVTHVTDGDTLRVRPLASSSKSDSLKVRIDGIDAPESCQLYGVQSTVALKKLILSKQITVFSKRFDDYGRDVAKITFNNIDVGGWMVKNGHAWSYHYRFSAGPYGQEEKAAARAKLGLFDNASAIEPRIFRRNHGSCYLPAKNDRTRDK